MQPIDLDILEALRKRLRQLPSSDRGDICAYWLDVLHVSPVLVAEFLGATAIAIRVHRCRALAIHPCGSVRGQCGGADGCAHERGKRAQHRVVRDVTANP